MSSVFYFFLPVFVAASFGNLWGYNFHNAFENWSEKKTELMAFFLPINPVILYVSNPLNAPPKEDFFKEVISLSSHTILSGFNHLPQVNVVWLDLKDQVFDVLTSCSSVINDSNLIYIRGCFFSQHPSSPNQIRNYLEKRGFRILTAWSRHHYYEIVFVNERFFDYHIDANFFALSQKDKIWKFMNSSYKSHYIPGLHAFFYLDDIEDGIKQHLRNGIYWEGGIGNLIKEHTKRDSIAIDVGAHIGIHTITMARKTGSRGAVIAFEPQKKIHGELLQNLKINRCNNVIPIRKALGSKPQMIQMNASNPLNEGGTAIGVGGDTAEMITLDSLHLTNVSLLKVDVERSEYDVFLGAINTIQRNKPVIIFEVMGEYDYENCSDEIKKRFEQVIDLIKSLGYKVDLIFGNDYLAIPET